MIAEGVGGWITNSLALIADAGHMLTDVAALGLTLAAIWFGARPATAKKTFGYYRLEILAAFVPGRTMDLVIMREATEGFYADRNMTRGSGECMPSPDMALATRKITRHCSERIARASFELAMTRRKKVTAIHKANCFLMTDGLFLEAVRHVAKDFAEVALDDLLIDASTAHMVREPERFDVICATNFFGDILSDLASELSGGIGLAGSVNASSKLCCAQAQHGSAPDIAGKNIANPTSMILSVAMLFNWMGTRHDKPALHEAAAAMERAVDTVLADPASRTRDLGGSMNTDAFGRQVAIALAR